MIYETIEKGNIGLLKTYTTSIFGKLPIEEEAKRFRDIGESLKDVYLRALIPLSISEEEEKEIKEKIDEVIRKFKEII